MENATLEPPPIALKSRFYRPELDLLRFFAFFCVLLGHGPKLADSSLHWRHIESRVFYFVSRGGVMGLCLFFFLSSFLITELLLREQEESGLVHLRWFYIRRILRIWPLYYVGVALGVITPILFHLQHWAHSQIIAFLLFIGYLGRANANPFDILWSISVEELFYAIWPLLSRGGAQRLVRASILILCLAPFASAFQDDAWRNPFAQFLFFGTGAIAAIYLRKHVWQSTGRVRLSLFLLGLALWFAVDPIAGLHPHALWNPIYFVVAEVGCVLVFLAFYGLRPKKTRMNEVLLYLGRISYGLYVFHMFFLRVLERALWGENLNHTRLVLTYSATLALTILTASISYRFLEAPFLKLKDRFALIQTRPAS